MTFNEFALQVGMWTFYGSLAIMVVTLVVMIYRRGQLRLTLEQYIYGLTRHLEKTFAVYKRSGWNPFRGDPRRN